MCRAFGLDRSKRPLFFNLAIPRDPLFVKNNVSLFSRSEIPLFFNDWPLRKPLPHFQGRAAPYPTPPPILNHPRHIYTTFIYEYPTLGMKQQSFYLFIHSEMRMLQNRLSRGDVKRKHYYTRSFVRILL